MATILTQTDKIILSKLLTLTAFGYYVLALNIANMVTQFVSPVFTGVFPKFSQLFAQGNSEKSLSELYHRTCQLVSLVILPISCVLALFSKQILDLWVHDPVIVQNSYVLLSLLTIGSTFNAIMFLPLALQLSTGWTKLSFLKNVVGVIIYMPLLFWLVSLYGATGAAIVWIILNAGYFFIEIPIMHSRILKNDMWLWYVKDNGLPFVAVILVTSLSALLMPFTGSFYLSLIWIALTGLISLLASTLTVPLGREYVAKIATL